MIDTILAQLDGVRKNGNSWEARCPAHEDSRASLSVSVGDDGKVVAKYHYGFLFN